MTKVKENIAILDELLNKKKSIEDEISKVREEISSEYLDYLKERFEEDDERYIILDDVYYHLGKFECLGWCWKKNAKKKPNYSNDYQVYFKLIHGFTTSLPSANKHGIDVNKQPAIELDTEYKDAKYNGLIYFKHNTQCIQFITKEIYDTTYEKIKNDYNFVTTDATAEDANGNTLRIGDKISYMSNGRGPFIDNISMIIGKKVYVKNSIDAHLANKTLKIN